MEIKFTHLWVDNFGWENTVFLPEDFDEVEKLGDNKEGIIYLAIQENGVKRILKNDLTL